MVESGGELAEPFACPGVVGSQGPRLRARRSVGDILEREDETSCIESEAMVLEPSYVGDVSEAYGEAGRSRRGSIGRADDSRRSAGGWRLAALTP